MSPTPFFAEARAGGRGRGRGGAGAAGRRRVEGGGRRRIVGLVFANLAGYAVGVAGVIAAFVVLTSGVLSALAVRHLEAQAKATRE